MSKAGKSPTLSTPKQIFKPMVIVQHIFAMGVGIESFLNPLAKKHLVNPSLVDLQKLPLAKKLMGENGGRMHQPRPPQAQCHIPRG